MLSSWEIPLIFTTCAWSCFACRFETETVLFEFFLRISITMCWVQLLIFSSLAEA